MPDLAAFAKNRRGRPKVEKPKEQVSVRLDPEALAAFRATGSGWQGRLNEVVVQAAKKMKKAHADA